MTRPGPSTFAACVTPSPDHRIADLEQQVEALFGLFVGLGARVDAYAALAAGSLPQEFSASYADSRTAAIQARKRRAEASGFRLIRCGGAS
jgi:hypothetical protein